MIPEKGNAWFLHTEHKYINTEHLPVFEKRQEIPEISKTYIFLQNHPGNEKTGTIHPGSSKYSNLAGIINIDIPFNILSKTAISPETSLDRQILVNLRVKAIIDEYEALKKRNEIVLEGLRIPYLERDESRKKIKEKLASQDISKEQEIKRNIENIVNFSGRYKFHSPQIKQLIFQETSTSKKNISALKNSTKTQPARDYSHDLGNDIIERSFKSGYSGNADIPWFFSFILKMIRYATTNKIEVFLIVTSLIMLSVISIMVIKR